MMLGSIDEITVATAGCGSHAASFPSRATAFSSFTHSFNSRPVAQAEASPPWINVALVNLYAIPLAKQALRSALFRCCLAFLGGQHAAAD